MKLVPMRYCGHTWHHNPLKMEIISDKKTVNLSVVNSCDVLQIFGDKLIVVKGVGQLYAEDVLQQYQQLLSLQKSNTQGVLCIPGLIPFFATMSELKVVADTTPDVLTYSFTFVQTKPIKHPQRIHRTISTQGYESLFDIANAYDVDIDTLVSLNPQIMFLNDLSNIQEVVVC